eukprot:scaffold7079_cov154-Pinguiococcus_pyrenoidosus.AAC.4
MEGSIWQIILIWKGLKRLCSSNRLLKCLPDLRWSECAMHVYVIEGFPKRLEQQVLAELEDREILLLPILLVDVVHKAEEQTAPAVAVGFLRAVTFTVAVS